MQDEAVLKLAKEISLSMMQLQARCDALEAAIVLLAEKSGSKREEVRQLITAAEKEALQQRMIRVEDKFGPGFSANLDNT